MSDWLLTDKEIVLKEVRIPTGDSIGGTPIVLAEKEIDIDATLKAEAKKLVIAISENSHMGKKYLNVNPQWWQAFQKEVEDG